MSLIEIQNLSKQYGTKVQAFSALSNVSLTIDAGETVCLAGPSGSGKTTLLNILGCIDPPDEGVYRFDGLDIPTQTESQLTRIREAKIGFIFQNFNLIPVFTVFENVEYPLLLRPSLTAAQRKDQVHHYLAKVGLSEFATRYPNQLSGGQQQRVAIARALVKHPKLVLADEPTANLDSKTSQDILSLLSTLNTTENITLVVASHDPVVIGYAKRIIRLRDGLILPGDAA